MRPLFLQSVLPHLVSEVGGQKLSSATWKCLGLAESELQRLMDPIEADLPEGAFLGYRTKFPENHLTLYWRTSSADFSSFAQRIRAILAPYAYTEADTELEALVVEQLKRRGLSLAFAESCTGGLCSSRITQVPGSSLSFFGGAVVYQSKAKKDLLGVAIEKETDAVSAECTLLLAKKLKERSGCSVAAAITGYMGPSGGTDLDPLGTVLHRSTGAKREAKEVSSLWLRSTSEPVGGFHFLSERSASGD